MSWGRYGDVISGSGTIDLRGDIVWDKKTFKTIRPAIKAGDVVRWVDTDGTREEGTVIATEDDKGNGKTWAWIKQEGKWARRTISSDALERIDPPKTESSDG